ncbi:MAG: hypothetical protein KDC15_11600, partial [Chitinophagaceae bacterium]|nr:hypothetical protein [Chitinophagaceae bacterium]
YNFQTGKFNQFIQTGKISDAIYAGYSESEKIRHSGFIAQEVEKVANETGYDFDGVIMPKTGKDAYGLSYSQFVVPLVKAVQEQQQMIEKQQKLIDTLTKEIERIKRKMN